MRELSEVRCRPRPQLAGGFCPSRQVVPTREVEPRRAAGRHDLVEAGSRVERVRVLGGAELRGQIFTTGLRRRPQADRPRQDSSIRAREEYAEVSRLARLIVVQCSLVPQALHQQGQTRSAARLAPNSPPPASSLLEGPGRFAEHMPSAR